MRATVVFDDGTRIEIGAPPPRCGIDFCDTCGDCLDCHGEEGGANQCESGHWWVIYEGAACGLPRGAEL